MQANAYQQYANETVSMASPFRLVTLMYDHLMMDIGKADRAIEKGDVAEAHEMLVHAQKIVSLLRTTLREDLWEGATQLHALYQVIHDRLVLANLYKDRERLKACVELVEPLHRAWHAAAEVASETMAAAKVA